MENFSVILHTYSSSTVKLESSFSEAVCCSGKIRLHILILPLSRNVTLASYLCSWNPSFLIWIRRETKLIWEGIMKITLDNVHGASASVAGTMAPNPFCKGPPSPKGALPSLEMLDEALWSLPHSKHSSISQNTTLQTSFKTKKGDCSELGRGDSKIKKRLGICPWWKF